MPCLSCETLTLDQLHLTRSSMRFGLAFGFRTNHWPSIADSDTLFTESLLFIGSSAFFGNQEGVLKLRQFQYEATYAFFPLWQFLKGSAVAKWAGHYPAIDFNGAEQRFVMQEERECLTLPLKSGRLKCAWFLPDWEHLEQTEVTIWVLCGCLRAPWVIAAYNERERQLLHFCF